jgi:hypothetical protein
MFGKLISGGLSFLGGQFSDSQGRKESKRNREFERNEAIAQRNWQSQEASTARDFNASEAEKSRSFSERMSSTAVQRRMQDMKLAGINPILAAKYDASTPASATAQTSIPTGSKASGSAYSKFDNNIQKAVHSAIDYNRLQNESEIADENVKRLKQEVQNLEATRNLTNAQIDSVVKGLEKLDKEILQIKANTDSRELQNELQRILNKFYKSNEFALIIKDQNNNVNSAISLGKSLLKNIVDEFAKSKLKNRPKIMSRGQRKRKLNRSFKR